MLVSFLYDLGCRGNGSGAMTDKAEAMSSAEIWFARRHDRICGEPYRPIDLITMDIIKAAQTEAYEAGRQQGLVQAAEYIAGRGDDQEEQILFEIAAATIKSLATKPGKK